jgi:hypothetical protein
MHRDLLPLAITQRLWRSARIAHQRSIELTHVENRIGNSGGCGGIIPPKAGLAGVRGAGDIIHAVGGRVGFSSSV